MFRPSQFAAKDFDDGPSLPRYSLSSYVSNDTSTNLSISRMMVNRKYEFDKILTNDEIRVPSEPELPIYTGSFILQQQFKPESERQKQLFTNYSRKFQQTEKPSVNTSFKIPIVPYRSRFDLYNDALSDTDAKTIEANYHKSNVTNFHNTTAPKEKKKEIEPLIPIRKYEREKHHFFRVSQNVPSNFDLTKYGLKSREQEEKERLEAVQKWTNQTTIKRVYPEALTEPHTDLFDLEKTTKNLEDSSSSSSSSSPVMKRKTTKKPSQNIQMIVQNGDKKPLFSQFQSDVFAKYAERKMNEMKAQQSGKQATPKKYDSSSDEFLFNQPQTENQNTINMMPGFQNDKNSRAFNQQNPRQSEVKFNFSKNDQFLNFNTAPVSNQIPNTYTCKAKEDYERRKAQIDEELKKEFEKKEESKPPAAKNIEDMYDQKETEDIMARLEQFKKQLEENKHSHQNLTLNRNIISDSDQPNSLLSESESADSCKSPQDDLLSEPSLIFEERPEIF